MPIDHTAMNIAMNVWLYNEKIIPLFCNTVSVLAVLHKLNRCVFIVNKFSFKITGVMITWLYKLDTTLKQTVGAGPKGIPIRDTCSWLYMDDM